MVAKAARQSALEIHELEARQANSRTRLDALFQSMLHAPLMASSNLLWA